MKSRHTSDDGFRVMQSQVANISPCPIGCTGGQHRSVFLTEALTQRLNDLDLDVQVVHRELSSGQ